MTSSKSLKGESRLSWVENGDLQPGATDGAVSQETWSDTLRHKLVGGDPRSCAGMCMLAFAFPLLVPGVTLTVVVYQDETGFAKYSALHIIGMILLSASLVLIVLGIAVSIRCHSQVTPEDDHQIVTTHDKPERKVSTHDIPDPDCRLSQRFNSHGSYQPHLPVRRVSPERIPDAARYDISQGVSAATEDITGSSEQAEVGSRNVVSVKLEHNSGLKSPVDTVEQLEVELSKRAYVSSSSSGSLDSDLSSASYSIHESGEEQEVETSANRLRPGDLNLNLKTFDWREATSGQDNQQTSFPFSSAKTFSFDSKLKSPLEWRKTQNNSIDKTVTLNTGEETVKESSLNGRLDDGGSPALRSRLYAISGDPTRPLSDGLAQKPLRYSGFSDDHSSIMESNSSVFRVESMSQPDVGQDKDDMSTSMDGQLASGQFNLSRMKVESPRPHSDGVIQEVRFAGLNRQSCPENLSSTLQCPSLTFDGVSTDSVTADQTRSADHGHETNDNFQMANSDIGFHSASNLFPISSIDDENNELHPAHKLVSPYHSTEYPTLSPDGCYAMTSTSVPDVLEPPVTNVTISIVSNQPNLNMPEASSGPLAAVNDRSQHTIRSDEFKLSDSTGGAAHDSVSNDMYTSSLGVFSS